MTEAQFLKVVIDMAHRFHWRVAHFRPAQTQRGAWVTPVQADGKGFPDLTMLRGGRLVVAELKVGYNKLSPEQDAWLEAFRRAGATVCVWRPRDLDNGAIEACLRETSADLVVGVPGGPPRRDAA